MVSPHAQLGAQEGLLHEGLGRRRDQTILSHTKEWKKICLCPSQGFSFQKGIRRPQKVVAIHEHVVLLRRDAREELLARRLVSSL